MKFEVITHSFNNPFRLENPYLGYVLDHGQKWLPQGRLGDTCGWKIIMSFIKQ